jgi:hypothetical protein
MDLHIIDFRKNISWDKSKNEWLKQTRGVSFEEIIQAPLVDSKKHPLRAHQNIFLFFYNNYIWLVPYVESGNEIFLKTLYPSRKYTRVYKGGAS